MDNDWQQSFRRRQRNITLKAIFFITAAIVLVAGGLTGLWPLSAPVAILVILILAAIG